MPASTQASQRRMHAFVRGRVQGVGFRATTLDEAQRLGLAGWVRNRLDGSVEVLAEGSQTTLEEFITYLQQGPRWAHVDSVDVEWHEAGGAPMPFQFKSTE
jgi:acylphosphatase